MMATTRFSPIGIGILPGRERPCLFETDQDTRKVIVLAYFTSVEAMDRFAAYEPRVNERKIGGVE